MKTGTISSKQLFITLVLITFTFVFSTSAYGISSIKSARFANDTKLQIFGNTVETDVVSVEKEGVEGAKNYVSARDLAENLGYKVSWDEGNKIISVGLNPENGKTVDIKDIEKLKPEAKKTLDTIMNKFSTRELDSLRKEMAYYQQLFGSDDPTIYGLLLAEDYKVYKNGGESQFDYIWKEMDK